MLPVYPRLRVRVGGLRLPGSFLSASPSLSPSNTSPLTSPTPPFTPSASLGGTSRSSARSSGLGSCSLMADLRARGGSGRTAAGAGGAGGVRPLSARDVLVLDLGEVQAQAALDVLRL